MEAKQLPPLYSGRALPVEKLSADQFEDFVFACMQCVADLIGLHITGRPRGSGDGGFDIQGRMANTDRVACIQCKRQQASLSATQVAVELAKVAATSKLERSDVGEHRFICTGGVSRTVIQQLRERSRDQLAYAAGERLVAASDGELATLRVRLEEAGFDPRQVVESYVHGLDVLIAWSFQEFDVTLSRRWDSVLTVIERFFRIETVVREFPRASFDRETYVLEHRDFRLAAEPRLSEAVLPVGLVLSSDAASPPERKLPQRHFTNLMELATLDAGSLVVLIGDGGAGKSAVLKLTRAEALRTDEGATLPVILALSKYVPGGLDRAIHQELGVHHGNWRSLPDKIILLCDGLNECPSYHVDAFFEELIPLLKRKQVSCIVSTREAIARTRIVLPQKPAACVQVDAITPVGISLIACEELGQGSAKAFVAAYRSLADTSGSPLLWTPFAVKVAISVWLGNAQLPPTLGEMLAVLLRHRCDRDIERSHRHLPPDVILLLSGALAFQAVVVDGRLACPAIEAGKWVRDAKLHCNEALGVSDMPEDSVVSLLIHHDLLYLSESGYYSFDHQLMAGALAAPLLAHSWRSNLRSLENSVSDDAWVFAARLVPAGHTPDFLTAVLNADLMLGARAARELPDALRMHVKTLLDDCVAPTSPEAVRIRGTFALAMLGGRDAIEKLKAMGQDVANPLQYQARRALAATGDEDFLREVLDIVDRLKSAPFAVSGGEVAIWESAPLPKRLDLARGRLSECNPGAPVGESLLLIALERNPEDVTLIEKHLAAATDLFGWQQALHALQAIAPIRAEQVLREVLASELTVSARARITRAAAFAGVPIDMRAAFECATAQIPESERDSSGDFALSLLISDVVAKSALPPDLMNAVERDLPASVGDRRARLWHLAQHCESPAIAQYALACIDAWGTDTGHACNFFLHQQRLLRPRRDALLMSCERHLLDESTWYQWSTTYVLELLAVLGMSATAADVLSAMVRRLVRVQDATITGQTDSLEDKERALLATMTPEHTRSHLAMLVAPLVPVVAQVRCLIPKATLLSLLQFDVHSSSVSDDLRAALSDCSDAEIDHVLEQVDELWTTLSGLVVVCQRGYTKTRGRLLEHLLGENYAHLAVIHQLCKAAEACWCREVLEAILRTVVRIERWTQYEEQFFWDVVRMVGRNIGKDDLPIIEVASADAKTPFAARILTLLRDQATGKRIGASWLISESQM
ncbi:restriction endonuclease [Burkholderia sp. L27(2015)]|uniref:restriction endonuclease n=1 Tax=Burkholderia sp. L27(2015) TaxID=1641858 RepID=UPI00131AD9C5|nr:restriction endonuclease [Burkholderia sp. L27(2015)]